MTSRAVGRPSGQGRWLSGCCWVAFTIIVVLGMTMEVGAYRGVLNSCPFCTTSYGTIHHCQHGFRWNGRTCTDIDECNSLTPPCRSGNLLCSNTPGSFYCRCPEQYIWDRRVRICIPTCLNYFTNDPRTKACVCHGGFNGTLCENYYPANAVVRIVGREEPGGFGGRVEVIQNGSWGAVCDQNWDFPDALVVCRQLGYADVVRVVPRFSRGTRPTVIGDIRCNGTEAKLSDCKHGDVHAHCSHNRDAGVLCDIDECDTPKNSTRHPCNTEISTCLNTLGSYVCTCNDSYNSSHGCTDTSKKGIRITGGGDRGRLEIRKGNQWGTVYATDASQWSMKDAQVACRQLGYDLAVEAITSITGTPQPLPSWLSYVDCVGNESTLWNCRHVSVPVQNHMFSVGVHCDIDECKPATPPKCGGTAVCFNTPGSYFCQCAEGYSYDGHTCTENTCTVPEAPANSKLSAPPGSNFTYPQTINITCENGYNLIGARTISCKDKKRGIVLNSECRDVNECSTGTHNCHGEATCINNQGSFTCVCKIGFTGNGTNCSDIQECTTGVHSCHTNANCHNTLGSYKCECHHRHTGNGHTCAAICLNGFTSDPITGSCFCEDGFNGTFCESFHPVQHNPSQCDNTCAWYVGKTTHAYSRSQAEQMRFAISRHYNLPVIFPRIDQANIGCVRSYVGTDKIVWAGGPAGTAMNSRSGGLALEKTTLPSTSTAFVFFEINGGCAQTIKHRHTSGGYWHYFLVTFTSESGALTYQQARQYCLRKNQESHNWHPAWDDVWNITTAAEALVGNNAWLSNYKNWDEKTAKRSNGDRILRSTEMPRLICLRTEGYDPTNGKPWYDKLWTVSRELINRI